MPKPSDFFRSLPSESYMESGKADETPVEQVKAPIGGEFVPETDPEKGSSINDFPKGDPSGGEVQEEEEFENIDQETKSVENTSNDFTIAPFLSKLIESGEFTEEELNEKFEDSLEGLEEVIKLRDSKREKEAELKAFEGLSEDARRIIELDKEGVDIRSILEFEAEEIEYASLDLTDIETQQDLYYNYLIETGLSEEKAAKKVNLSLTSGDLEDDAKDAVEFLSKKQSAEKEQLINTQREQARIQKEQEKAQYEAWIKDVSETKQIKGFEVTKAEASKLVEFMTKPVDKSGKTQEQLAWEDPETRKAFNYFLMKKFDFKSLEKKAETKATIKMKAKVANISDKGMSSKGTGIKTEETNDTPRPAINYFRTFK